MPKVSTNITLDPELKRSAQELYADLGLDLSTAVTIFLKQSLRVGGIPFPVVRTDPPRLTADEILKDLALSREQIATGQGMDAAEALLEMGKANFEVAWRVLSGNIRPGIVQVKSGMKSEGQLVALANSITLTPGTLTVEVREKGDGSMPDELFVHLLAVPDGMEKRGKVKARELFGRFDCPEWIRRMVP